MPAMHLGMMVNLLKKQSWGMFEDSFTDWIQRAALNSRIGRIFILKMSIALVYIILSGA